MTDIKSKIQEIYSLEQLSRQKSPVHSRHPSVKLISALVYIITVVSFDTAEFSRLIPFVFYPVILMSLSGTPWKPVLKRAAIALPFAVLAGISNIIYDREAVYIIGSLIISRGMLSFASLLIRTFYCVTAVLILIAVTPFGELSDQLRRMHVPGIFVLIFEMTYRYIGALLEEASSMYTAYILRSTKHKGLQIRHMGSFIGQLLIRSFDRAERVYSAMKCRGYSEIYRLKKVKRLLPADYIYLILACLPFITLRVYDISALFAA